MADPRSRLPHHEQMADAQAGCVPCKLCGGQAVISDAGTGAGYYIKCSGTTSWRASTGCMIDVRRLGGWAYNVRDWWNRLHSTDATDGATGGGEGVGREELMEMLDLWHRHTAWPEASRSELQHAADGIVRATTPGGDLLEQAVEAHARWLDEIATNCDMAAIVADGGVTAGMVVQQEAREQRRRLLRALSPARDGAGS